MAEEIISVKQYLTFILEEELFSLPIFKVREVVELSRITKVPKAQEFMVGIINLRGNVVPVVDLRIKFGLKLKAFSQDTSIIITEVRINDEIVIVGLLVDAVKEVIDLLDGQLEETPAIGMNLDRKFITAIGKREDSFIIILDIDNVFSGKELESVKESMSLQDTLNKEPVH